MADHDTDLNYCSPTPGPDPIDIPTATEPCESCGTPVTLQDLAGIVRLIAGLDPVAERPEFVETRSTSTPTGFFLEMRPHTPELCRAVRAGTPVPWSDPEDDDDDD